MRPPRDLSLCLVVGADATGGRPVIDVVRQAVDGGATMVQLREKQATTRAFIDEARALLTILRPIGIPLVINDRVDVALAACADGVHVGQDDMPVADVRRLIGEEMIVGFSVTTLAEAADVDASLVDYAGVGPVYATPTKPDAARPLGLDGVAAVCRVLRVPAIAIGGIHAGSVAAVMATGVRGIAVVSAIASAREPRAAAAALRQQMRRGSAA